MLHRTNALYTFLMVFYWAIPSLGYAENDLFKNGFDQGKTTAIASQNMAYSAIQDFKPDKFIKNYSSNPKEVNYMNNPDQMGADTTTAKEDELVGKTIMEGMKDRQSQYHYRIDANSAAIQNVQKQADDVYDVITGQFKEFGDCTKQTRCTTDYSEKICEESPKVITQYCHKFLVVDLVPHQVDVHYYLNAKLTVKNNDYAGVSVNAVNGDINFIGPSKTSFQLDHYLPSDIDCHSFHGKVASVNGSAQLDYINLPSCANGLTLDFHFSKGHDINISIDMVSTKIEYAAQDRWQDDCSLFSNSKSCSFKEEHCISHNATRNIQNMAVTRPCWEKEASYSCSGDVDGSNCQSYRNEGCEQIDSQCTNRNDSGCLHYKQTFRCPSKHCENVGMICNGQTYCLTGDCIKQQKQADPDFQYAVATLAAVKEASKSYNIHQGSQYPIFSGEVKTCNKDFLNFANCCSDSGWGVDLNLARCNQEAKDLGVAKGKGLVVYIDSEEDCTLGLCGHKKRYCVFPSKLARIIQESGRQNQLHISFGNYENPDCRGLAPSEFAQLDLKAINFSEVFADISKLVKIEDKTLSNERVNTSAQTLVKEKRPYEHIPL